MTDLYSNSWQFIGHPLIESLYPGWPLIAWPILIAIAGSWMRRVLSLVLPLLVGFLLLTLPNGSVWEIEAAGYFLMPFRLDALSRLFTVIYLLITLIANIYSWSERSRTQQVSAQIYAASSMMAVLAGDLLTLLIAWEIMAVSSAILIWGRGTRRAARAMWHFLMVHLLGGSLLFAGIFITYTSHQSWMFNTLQMDLGGCLILISFAINAAIPPLHAWLPDSYPESTPQGAVFLCVFTTKTAIYTLARGFAGAEILIWAGLLAALYGVIYALMQNDIRRILAYHLICQIGYMVVGIGLGTETAINGGVAHAVNHILYKGLLFMSCGAVLQVTGKTKLTQLGALIRGMPYSFVMLMVGAFAISGAPWFNGYISKSMIFEEAAHYSSWVELGLILSSAGTFLSIGLKLAYFAFIAPGKNPPPTNEAPISMRIGMTLAGALCILIGVWPESLYFLLPYPVHHSPYTPSHVIHTIQMMLFTAFGFTLVLKYLKPHAGRTLDTDWFYRKWLVRAWPIAVAACSQAWRTALGLGKDGFQWFLRLPVLGRADEVTSTNPAFWVLASLVIVGWFILRHLIV